MRYAIFCAKRGKIESHKLPPCRDKNYIFHANYQCFVWRKCLQQSPDILDLEDSGWKYENGLVLCIWMNGLPALKAVLSLLSCDCKRRFVEGKCSCMVNGIKCTDMCSLKTCDNQPHEGVVDEKDDQDEHEIDLDENEDDKNFAIDFD